MSNKVLHISYIFFTGFLIAIIMSTGMLLPINGWQIDTIWGEWLTSIHGKALLGLVAVLAIFAGFLTRRFIVVIIAIPAVLMILLSPKHFSLSSGIYESFLEFDLVIAELTASASNDDVTSFTEQKEQSIARIDASVQETENLLTGSFFAPNNYALRTQLATWIEIEAQSAKNALDQKSFDRRNIEKLEDSLDELDRRYKAAIKNCDRILSKPRGIGQLFTLRKVAYRHCIKSTGLLKRQRDVFKKRYQKAIAIEQANNENQVSSAKAALISIKQQEQLLDVAYDRLENWRSSVIIAGVTLVVVFLIALLAPQAISIVSYLALGSVGIGLFWYLFPQIFTGKAILIPFVIIHLAMTLIVFLSGYALRLLYLHNVDLWHRFKLRERIHILLGTALWWIPLGLFVAIGVWLSMLFNGLTNQIAYNIPLNDEAVVYNNPLCQNSGHLIYPAASDGFLLEADIDNVVRCVFEQTSADAADAEVKINADMAADAATDAATKFFDSVIPKSLPADVNGPREFAISAAFNYQSCGFFNVICGIKNIPYHAADEAYSSTRSLYRQQFINNVRKQAEEAKDLIDSGQTFVNGQTKTASAIIDQMVFDVRNQIWASFRVWDFINMIGLMIFAMALLKSIGFVLARVTYNMRRGLGFTTDGGREAMAKMDYQISHGSKMTLKQNGRYFIIMGQSPNNVIVTGPTLRKPWQVFFWRIPSLFLFDKFDIDKDGCAELVCVEPQKLVAIELQEGQRLAFKFPQLYAFSQGISFKRFWDFRLSNLMRGKASYVQASGVGTLVLRTNGALDELPSLNNAKESNAVARKSHERLLAWSPHADFDIESNVSLAGMYMGNYTVGRLNEDTILFDNGMRTGKFSGALRFIPMLLLPF